MRERDQKAGEAWVTALVRNTRTLASGGREATDAFVKNGVGDVLLTFENEALFVAKASAAPIEFVVPPVNVRTDFPVVVVDRVVDQARHARRRRGVRAVPLRSAGPGPLRGGGLPSGGPRARKAAAGKFGDVPKLFSIDDLGGWSKVDLDDLRRRRALRSRCSARRSLMSAVGALGVASPAWRLSRLEVVVLVYLAIAGAVPPRRRRSSSPGRRRTSHGTP